MSPWSQTHMNRNSDKNYELYWAIFCSSLLRNSSLHYVLNKIFFYGKAFIGYRWCFGAFWSANNLPWPWPCTTDLASNFLTKWQFWQLTFKWLSRARAQDKTKQYYCYFFFLFLQDFIQLCDSRIRDSCEIGFRVQFNVEFPRQVMNFPIK